MRSIHKVIKKTLEDLKDLQEIFNKKFKLEEQLAELPKEITNKEEVVVRLKEDFLSINEQFNLQKEEVNRKRDELSDLQSYRSKLEKEIAHVNHQRDYEKIDKSIKENQENEQLVLRECASQEKKLENLREELSSAESLLREQENDLNTTKTSSEQKINEFEQQISELKKQESVVATELDENLVFKFERIIRSKPGNGVVPIRKNVCYGCYMQLTQQFVNKVYRGDEILTCPHCSKIVYYDGDNDDDEVKSAEIAGLQDLMNSGNIEIDDFDDSDFEQFIQNDDIGSDTYVPALNSEDDEPVDEDDEEVEERDEDNAEFEEEFSEEFAEEEEVELEE